MITNEDVELIEKIIELKNKGYYVNGGQVTNLYNKIFNKSLAPTNCGSCINGRVREIEAAYKSYIKAQEALKQEQPTDVKADENKAVEQPKNKRKKKE